MHLVKSLADSHTPLFQLYLHHRQPIYQYRDIVTVRLFPELLKLINHLYFVAGNIRLVCQVYILNMPIIKHKVIDVITVYFLCFFNRAVALLVQIFLQKATPFRIGKNDIVECLQLVSRIAEQGVRRNKAGNIFVTL